MVSRARPSLLMLRWLALGAASGAAVMLLLDVAGLAGPWQGIALVLTLLAAFAAAAVAYFVRERERELVRAVASARQHDAERAALEAQLERHAQLEVQLRQAKQAAESAVMAKGEFLATMSHEIRTPLNGIVPMLDLLMHAELAPEHADLVRTAYTSSQQMLRIVDDILDYSKLEAAKLELEITSFNLREMLEGVVQMMERPAQSKGLRLHLQIDPGVRLPVRGDPVRLRQVLGNLVSNAVKFTERGSVTVSVRRIGETSAQHQLRFEVRDTGIGIAPSAQPRLFQAFSQADASTTRLYGGTGLGLAISKRIVELMEGHIGVDSAPGKGSTFWFELPLLKVHGDLPAQERLADGKRLLLLSADPRLRLRLSMLLPNWGLRVTSVETTQEALNRLRTAAGQGEPWAYSLVLADLAGMRHTALALYRNLNRQEVYGDLQLVGLYGDEPVPPELQAGTTLISRQAPDADLRAALIGQGEPPLHETVAADVDAMLAAPGVAPAQAPAAAIPAAEPAGADAPAPAGAAPVAAPAQPADAAGPRKPRVLLVEDNPVNLMVGQRLLAMLDITCDTAGNGEAALLRMSASRYDVVLMDCQMPVMDGYTATRRWRESESARGDGRRLPIIAMTANAMAGDRQRCLDAGMDDYLPKPVTRSELERCLYQWWNPAQDEPPVDPSAGLGEFVAMEPEAAPERDAVPAAPAAPPPRDDAAPPIAASAPPAPVPEPTVPEPTVPAPAAEPAATVAAVAAPSATVEAATGTAVRHRHGADVPAPPVAASTPPRGSGADTPEPVPRPAAPAPQREAPDDTASAIAGPEPTAPTPRRGQGHGTDAAPTASPSPPPAPTAPARPVAPAAPPATVPAPAPAPAAPAAPSAPRSGVRAALPASQDTAPRMPTTAPPQPTPRLPVIDAEVMDELRAMLGDEIERLIAVFLEDTPRLIARLEAAAAESDYATLRDTAHSLKSSSANLGAMMLSAAARRIEIGAREGRLERPAVAVALVSNEFARVRGQLKSGNNAAAV